jgi:hypothetical protein
MTLNNSIFIPAAIAAMAITSFAQQPLFSPVPILAKDSSIPAGLKGGGVFLSPATGELVVAYPDAQGQQRVIRFGKHNQVAPVLRASVAQSADGTYSYGYVLQNGPAAQKHLSAISIQIANDPKAAAAHPTWAGNVSAAGESRPGAIHPETQFTWTAPANGELEPLGSTSGFQITSRFRPGVAVAFAQNRATSEYSAAAAKNLPDSIQAQMAVALSPSWDSAQTVTIAPRFDSNVPKDLIASDFHRWISHLSTVGTLSADSPFVKSALASLTSYVQSPGAQTLIPDLSFLATAAPGLETEIATAMRLSLR